MYYVGIDLAWTYKNDSGIAIFDEDKTLVFCHAINYSDQELKEITDRFKPNIISVDSPLQVANEKGGRPVDSELMKEKINGRHLKLYATSRSYMMRTFKTIRGENLYQIFNDYALGKDIVETYPTGIYLSLFPNLFDKRYKLSSRQPLAVLKENANNLINGIQTLGFKNICIDLDAIKTKVAYKKTEDQLDAILCALNSYYFHKNQCLIKGDGTNGIISLPST